MFKFYLDIDKKEQEKKLESRKKDPLKHKARLNLIKYFLLNVDYKDKNEKILNVDPNIVIVYNKNFLSHN